MRKNLSYVLLMLIVLSAGCSQKAPPPTHQVQLESSTKINAKPGRDIISYLRQEGGIPLTPMEERQILTCFDSLNGKTKIKGISFFVADRSLNYTIINGHTACIRTKNLTVQYEGATAKRLICQTTDYNWVFM